MAIAFRSLVRITERTKRNVGQNYLRKNVFSARIDYESSSSLLGNRNIFFSQKKVDCETSIESSHARQFHTTIQRAEIVKFHLSDIGKYPKEVLSYLISIRYKNKRLSGMNTWRIIAGNMSNISLIFISPPIK